MNFFNNYFLGTQKRDELIWQLMRPVPCCPKNCIRGDLTNAEHFNFIKGCVDEYFGLKRDPKSSYMMEKIRGCMMEPRVNDKKGRYSWTIGVLPNKVISNVCPRAFQLIYNISHATIERISHEIKLGAIVRDKPFTDLASIPTCGKQHTTKAIESVCETFDIIYSRPMKQVLLSYHNFS